MSKPLAVVLKDFQLEEYKALRVELDRRGKVRYQVLLSLVAFTGAYIVYVLGKEPLAGIAFALYPWLAFLLAYTWWHNHRRTMQVSEFIRDSYEQPLGYSGWESKMTDPKSLSIGSLVPTALTFVAFQIVTLLLSDSTFRETGELTSNGELTVWQEMGAIGLALTLLLFCIGLFSEISRGFSGKK